MFTDPFGLCHTVTDEEEKKKCKLRDPDEHENDELDALEKDLAASGNTMCRQAGAALGELRRQGGVKFYDQEFRNGKVLMGDADVNATGPVHLYSGRGSNWTETYRSMVIRSTAVHEIGHTFGMLDEGDPDKLSEDCTGTRRIN